MVTHGTKDKEKFIIRITKVVKKIKRYYEIIKADVIKTLSGTKAECALPIDFDDLERIVLCVIPDIVKYYEEKRNNKSEAEAFVPLTNDTVLTDNEGAENLYQKIKEE